MDSITVYRENDVEYKELTEQKDIQKILSMLTSLKIYEHNPKDPEETGVLNMTFDLRLTDGSVETIRLVEAADRNIIKFAEHADCKERLIHGFYFYL